MGGGQGRVSAVALWEREHGVYEGPSKVERGLGRDPERREIGDLLIISLYSTQ